MARAARAGNFTASNHCSALHALHRKIPRAKLFGDRSRDRSSSGARLSSLEGSITIIDLPEILALTFLYLHTRFPQVPFGDAQRNNKRVFPGADEGDESQRVTAPLHQITQPQNPMLMRLCHLDKFFP